MGLLTGLLSLFLSTQPQQFAYADVQNMIILDVRTAQEFNTGHVIGAQNIDLFLPDFKNQISKLDKSKNYKVYCRSGNRSGQAIKIMQSMGFKNLENLGGIHQAAKKLNLNCSQPNAC